MKKMLLLFLMMCFVMAAQAQVVFTEIMYNPPESGNDSLEYIEIANIGAASINLDGYTLEGVTHTFSGVTLTPDQHYALCISPSAMQAVFGVTVAPWTSGALSNAGETVRLKDASGAIVDSVAYGNTTPWPLGASAGGSSMELCNFLADNSLPEFWIASTNGTGVTINGLEVFGTPGAANTAVCESAADVIITVGNFSFSPADITIFVGQTVQWNFVAGSHNVNGSLATYPANPEGFFSGNPGAVTEFLYTFNVPGFYNYRCNPHFSMGMVGTVTVIEPVIPKIAITEIMYQDPTPSDTSEFIELYNYGSTPIEMDGISFSQGVSYTFGQYTLNAGETVIVAKNAALIDQYTTAQVFQWSGVLANTGETIELKDVLGNQIDLVSYGSTAPWITLPADQMVSLAICDPEGDNNTPSNWVANTSMITAPFPFMVFADPGIVSPCESTIIANDDAWNVESGQNVLLEPLSNDFNSAGFGSSVILSSNTNGIGTFTYTDGLLAFNSTAGLCGEATFTYQYCNDLGSCDTADIVITVECPLSYPNYTVGQVTTTNTDGVADSVGVVCQLEGIVYGVNLRPAGLQFFINDNNGDGLGTFLNTGSFGYTVQEGDRVKIQGAIAQFNGLIQMSLDSVILVSSNNPLEQSSLVSQLDETTESQLVTTGEVWFVDASQWPATPSGSGFNFDVTDGTNTFNIRIDADVEIFNQPPPPPFSSFSVTGMGSQFDSDSPFLSGYQLLPRYAADITIINGTENTLAADVRISPNPFGTEFAITAKENITNARVFDALGRQIWQQTGTPTNSLHIGSDKWPTGTYTVSAIIAGQTIVRRVVKL